MSPCSPSVGVLTAFLTAAFEGLGSGRASHVKRVVSISKLPLNAQVGKWPFKLSYASETDPLGFNSRDQMPKLRACGERGPGRPGVSFSKCVPLFPSEPDPARDHLLSPLVQEGAGHWESFHRSKGTWACGDPGRGKDWAGRTVWGTAVRCPPSSQGPCTDLGLGDPEAQHLDLSAEDTLLTLCDLQYTAHMVRLYCPSCNTVCITWSHPTAYYSTYI